jgi:hypothetical protein
MTITADTIAALNLSLNEREAQQFAQLARGVPADRMDEARRCYAIALRISFSYPVNINWQQLGGKTDEQIAALVDARVAQAKRSAGGKAAKRALEQKYGHEAAERIISEKKGGRK